MKNWHCLARRTGAGALLLPVLLFALLLTMPALGLAKQQDIPPAAVMLTSTEYPPYYGSDLPGQGPLVQLVQAVFARSGRPLQVDIMPWPRALKAGAMQGYQGILGVWDSAERRRHFLFSSALAYNELRLFSLTPLGEQSLHELAASKPRLGLVRDYVYPPAVYQAGFVVQQVGGDAELLQMLLKGRVDLILADTGGTFYLQQQLAPNARLYAGTTALSKNALYLVLNKQDPQAAGLLAEFEQGLARLKASGEADKWLAPLQYIQP